MVKSGKKPTKYKLFIRYFTQSRSYSLQRRILGYSVCVVVFVALSAFFIGGYYSSLLVQNTYQSQQDILDNYNERLTRDLFAAESCLISYPNENIDIGMLTTLDSPQAVLPYKIRVNSLFSTTLLYMSNIDGMFLYAPRTDSWICNCSDINHYPVSEYLKGLFRTHSENELLEALPIDRWIFTSVGGEYYLLRMIPSNYCYIGAWVHLDTLKESLTNLSTYFTSYYFVKSDGTPLIADSSVDGIFPPIDEGTHSYTQNLKGNDGKEYLAVTSNFPFCDYYIAALISMRDIRVSMMSVYWGIMLTGISAVILIGTIFWTLSKLVRRPLTVLQQTSDQLHRGDFDTRLTTVDEPCLELREIDEAINNLLDEIGELRIHIYEEQIARTEFELQYLKSQIAPHFLINCFQTLYALPNTPDGQALTQRMIHTLSDHLRYTLNAGSQVPLSRELHYVKNYVELTDIRFPKCMTYECNVEPSCANAAVFPMVLLMLTENTIKYNLVMGEPLILKITGYAVTRDGTPYIHLTHIDSGDGYDKNTLDKLNKLDVDDMPKPNGYQVGLYNVLKRMKILYHGQGKIHFSNEPRMGARIDIDIPYTEYLSEETNAEANPGQKTNRS